MNTATAGHRVALADALREQCKDWATAERGLTRSLGISGLFALGISQNHFVVATTTVNDSYREELARIEAEFAKAAAHQTACV